MFLIITITLAFLVFVNFLLLKFSCNKNVKETKVIKRPVIINSKLTIVSESEPLAPTGS